ncbi:MAG: hypothetical protein RL591_1455, partial [Planctomycetota bacterium]
ALGSAWTLRSLNAAKATSRTRVSFGMRGVQLCAALGSTGSLRRSVALVGSELSKSVAVSLDQAHRCAWPFRPRHQRHLQRCLLNRASKLEGRRTGVLATVWATVWATVLATLQRFRSQRGRQAPREPRRPQNVLHRFAVLDAAGVRVLALDRLNDETLANRAGRRLDALR